MRGGDLQLRATAISELEALFAVRTSWSHAEFLALGELRLVELSRRIQKIPRL